MTESTIVESLWSIVGECRGDIGEPSDSSSWYHGSRSVTCGLRLRLFFHRIEIFSTARCSSSQFISHNPHLLLPYFLIISTSSSKRQL